MFPSNKLLNITESSSKVQRQTLKFNVEIVTCLRPMHVTLITLNKMETQIIEDRTSTKDDNVS